MADIFQEIDEDVRRDQMATYWQRYGKYVVAAAVVLALIAGGIAYWREQQERKAAAAGAQFAEALTLVREGKSAEAALALVALQNQSGPGYRALAGLRAAAVLAADKKLVEAIAAYDKIAADSSVETAFRDLARLLASLHSLDTAKAEEIEQRLQPVLGEGNLWRHLARELVAAAKLKAGDTAGARLAFQQLADDATAPAGVRARAAELLAALGPEG